MKRLLAVILSLVMMLALCACGHEDEEAPERECGVFITVEADDIYNISCGTELGSEGMQNADKSAIKAGTVVHFDFAGKSAEKNESVFIDYSICIMDKDLEEIASESFKDDFSNMARIDLIITEDHAIIYKGVESTCGGDVIVDFTASQEHDNLSMNCANVTINSCPAAAETINAALQEMYTDFGETRYNENTAAYADYIATASSPVSFSMERNTEIFRGDKAVLSMLFSDTVFCGSSTDGTLANAHNYSCETGAELTLKDIAADEQKLIAFCIEEIQAQTLDGSLFDEDLTFNQGYADVIQEFVNDGYWYFTNEGIVFFANPGLIASADMGSIKFTISYDKLKDLINKSYIPVSNASEEGDIQASYTDNLDTADLSFVGIDAEGMENPVIIAVSGNIFDIRAYELESGNKGSQLFYCSDLSNGGAFAIDKELSSSPNLLLSFTLGDGNVERRVLSDVGGKLIVTNPDREEGIVITEALPFSFDLNNDDAEEEIDVADSDELKEIVVKAGDNELKFSTELSALKSLRIFDVDNDGSYEIYADGTLASGEEVLYCLLLGKDEITAAKFGDKDYCVGSFAMFSDGKLQVTGEMEFIVSQAADISYELGDGKFTVCDNVYVAFGEGSDTLKVIAELKATDATLNSGSEINLIGYDSKLIYYKTTGGIEGSFEYSKSDDGKIMIGDKSWDKYLKVN